MGPVDPGGLRSGGADSTPDAQFRSLAGVLDSLHVGLCLFDAEDRTLFWNRTFLRLFPEHDGKVHAGEPYAANLERFYTCRHPDEAPAARAQRVAEGIARHRSQTQPYVFEHHGQWVRVASERLPDGGRVRLWTPIARPEGALRHAGPATDLPLAEVLPFAAGDGDGVTIADGAGRILQANERFAASFGLPSPEAAEGRTHAELYAACWQADPAGSQAAPQLETLIEAERFTGAPFELPLPGDRWVRVLQQRLPDTRVVSTFADISAMKAMERDLRAAREAAERSNRAKDGFLAMISHELRTPMNGILGMLELLDDGLLRDEQAERLHHARQSANALLGLLDDILLFSRLEAGPMPIERGPADPSELLGSVARLLQPQAVRKGLSLRWSVAGDLPARIACDAPRLRQVLLNLASNALKFTEAGQVLLSARRGVALPQGGFLIEFEVEDSGIGIPQATLEQIFQPFTQADSSISRRFGGTGLGLAISRRLVEAMGGSIAVESTVGVGSRFRFALPCEAAIAAVMSTPPPRPGPPAALADRRALVVDDHPTNREVARLYLERLGLRVETAADGAAALAACGKPFDVILMDLEMPAMDGFAVARAIRESALPAAAAPIIALTAHAGQDHRARCRDAGMLGFVAKPIRPDHLQEALLAAVEVAQRATPTAPLLDLRRVQLLAGHVPAASWPGMVQSFAEACGETLAAIAAPGRTREECAQALHRLKGAAWNFGAKRLGDLAAALEAEMPTDIAARREELAQVFEETIQALRRAEAA